MIREYFIWEIDHAMKTSRALIAGRLESGTNFLKQTFGTILKII